MTNLRQALSLGSGRDGWRKFLRALERVMPRCRQGSTRLRETFDFGSNPGNLRMFGYRPPTLADNPHSSSCCTDAPRPQQDTILGPDGRPSRTVTVLRCFCRSSSGPTIQTVVLIGFSPRTAGATRGTSFDWQMIEKSVVDHGIDRRRVFITGLSAGGAMTSIMLACYPEVFAGGAIVAGLPYGAATNVQQAFETYVSKSPTLGA